MMAVPYEQPTKPAPRAPAKPAVKQRPGARGVAPTTEHTAGQGAPAGSIAPVDWSSLLGESGLPPNVVNELNRIFTRTPDINQAITIGQAYVRSTPWYTQTFPGIQSGINAGLFSNEQGYRQYQNQLGQLYQQYHNRQPTQAELAQHVVGGQSLDLISRQMQGSAYIQANAPDIQRTLGAQGTTGALNQQQLTALGQEQAGIDTPLGQQLTVAYQKAQRRLEGAFNGVLAHPALSFMTGTPVTRGANQPPDVGA